MKIAIPVWGGKISPVFDTASKLLMFEVHDWSETQRSEVFLHENDLTKRCYRIRSLDIDVLICGAISRPFSRMLVSSGVSVIAWISGDAKDVFEAYLDGKLDQSRFFMPGFNREM